MSSGVSPQVPSIQTQKETASKRKDELNASHRNSSAKMPSYVPAKKGSFMVEKVPHESKVWIKVRDHVDSIRQFDFKTVTEKHPKVRDREILVVAVTWSVKQRHHATNEIANGSPLPGDVLCVVVSSRNPAFPIGSCCIIPMGWRESAVIAPDTMPTRPVPDLRPLGLSHIVVHTYLSSFSLMLYFAFFHVCQPKARETVLISCVGRYMAVTLGQFALIRGCHVIVFVNSRGDAAELRSLGLTHVFNYPAINPVAALRLVAPDGVDVYCDGAGKSFTDRILSCFSPRTRWVTLGENARYRRTLAGPYTPDLSFPYSFIAMRNLQVSFYHLYDFWDLIPKAQADILQWCKESRLVYRRSAAYKGFDQLPTALCGLVRDITIVEREAELPATLDTVASRQARSLKQEAFRAGSRLIQVLPRVKKSRHGSMEAVKQIKP